MKKIVSIILIIVIFVFYGSDILDFGYKLKDSLFERHYNEEHSNAVEDIQSESIEQNSVNQDINNYENIRIGDSTQTVKSFIGEPSRIDKSEYSFDWYVYNQYGEKFVMVGIENDAVVAFYSNSMNSYETEGIQLNQNREYIRSNYSPIEYKEKGNTRYMINSKDEYDIINKGKKYITVFYDIHYENRVCSYLIVDEYIENHFNGIYPEESEEIKKSFELEMVDLVNSVRLKRGLISLEYSEAATQSSRNHSNDMMVSNFFDHINKKNETPFDRMQKEGILYSKAGENIAAGQVNSIYAHEALMNSLGHRKNILGDYNNIGVGVVFGGSYKTYYTQNFYSGI